MPVLQAVRTNSICEWIILCFYTVTVLAVSIFTQDGIEVLRKSHKRSAPFFRSPPKVALKSMNTVDLVEHTFFQTMEGNPCTTFICHFSCLQAISAVMLCVLFFLRKVCVPLSSSALQCWGSLQYLLCMLFYLFAYSFWLCHDQGSRSNVIFLAEHYVWPHTRQGSTSQTSSLLQFHKVCNNDALSDLWVTLGGQPQYNMCDHIYCQAQSGGDGFVGVVYFVYGPSVLLESEASSKLVLGDIGTCVDQHLLWLAVGFSEHLCFKTGICSATLTAAHAQTFRQQSLVVILDFWTLSLIICLHQLSQTAHILNLLFCFAHSGIACSQCAHIETDFL